MLIHASIGFWVVTSFKIGETEPHSTFGCLSPADGVEVTSLPGVPCTDPHDNEVFAVFDVNRSAYPDSEAMESLAYDSCLERFEPFVGRDYETSSLDILSMYPTRTSWALQDDREVVCAVYDMEASKLRGSAKGLAL